MLSVFSVSDTEVPYDGRCVELQAVGFRGSRYPTPTRMNTGYNAIEVRLHLLDTKALPCIDW